MSTLKVNTLTDTAATKSVPIEDVVNGSARAWVNFNGTGTVAIREQYNVDSITDNGTGDYTVNFTTALLDVNYTSVIGGASPVSLAADATTARTTTTFRIRVFNTAFALTDYSHIECAFFR